jgi:fructose-1,6-bisphosphatase
VSFDFFGDERTVVEDVAQLHAVGPLASEAEEHTAVLPHGSRASMPAAADPLDGMERTLVMAPQPTPSSINDENLEDSMTRIRR